MNCTSDRCRQGRRGPCKTPDVCSIPDKRAYRRVVVELVFVAGILVGMLIGSLVVGSFL